MSSDELQKPENGEDAVMTDAPEAVGQKQEGEEEVRTNGEKHEEEPNGKKDVKLEDLFNDDDEEEEEEEEEFPASSAVQSKLESSPPLTTEPKPAPAQVDNETMYAFYQRLFPFRYLFQWLNHGVKPAPDFGNREFAFTLQNEAYLRYQSFYTADLLRKDILRLNPSRFEIGPQYSTNPRDRKSLRKSSAFKPIAKELVFDIDLTDYDEIRTCCTKANICAKCWTFVTMAIKVIDVALREDFGFQHIMWVYSGRRGAHAWVCDKKARNLPDDRRRAIASYLELVRGGSQSGKKINVKRPLHPHVARSLEILKPYFASTILEEQDTFSTSEQAHRLLALLPDKSLTTSLRKKWDSAPDRSSMNKWSDIDTVAKTAKSSDATRGKLDTKALLEAKQDIVLEYTYPRLDAEVSKKLIHLLKSPFVVHPGTGRVCVPIDIAKLESFDPFSVPTVSSLLAEINSWDINKSSEISTSAQQQNGNNGLLASDAPDGASSVPDMEHAQSKRVQDYEKTSLKPYIDYFRRFVAGLLKDEKGSGKRDRDGEDGGSGADAMEF